VTGPDPRAHADDEAPPLPWPALYALVVGWLAVVIALLAWLTGRWR
jgi:hypothetical protein